MTQPLPEIGETDATGRIATLYADIRATQKLGLVNLIWRHLATQPDALEWVWGRLRPVYANGIAADEANKLCAGLHIPRLPQAPASALEALGLSAAARRDIRRLLATYNRGNSLNLVALSSLRLAADEQPSEIRSIELDTESPLPPIPSISSLDEAVQALVYELNGIGTAGQTNPVIASLYRHLALWPAYLSFAWAQLAPLALDGTLKEIIAGLQDTTQPFARRAGRAIDSSISTPAEEVQQFANHAVEHFLTTAISRMVPIGLMLHRSLAETE